MFGLNMLGVYGDYKISFLGGATLNLVVTLVIRLVVGIGWYKMFERAGKTGWLAFVPVLGAYNAFRLTCDDFSWAALFGGTTFIAWVDAVGIEHPIVTGCAVCNFIMWWAYVLMTAHVYRTSYFFGMIYGVFPWLGAIIFGFGPNMEYYEPVSLLPEDQQRAKKQEQKEERKKINAATSRAANSRPSNKKRKK